MLGEGERDRESDRQTGRQRYKGEKSEGEKCKSQQIQAWGADRKTGWLKVKKWVETAASGTRSNPTVHPTLGK